MAKLELNLAERLAALKLLPSEGNFLTLKSIRKLREDLGLKEEEVELFGAKVEAGSITWDVKKGLQEVMIEVSDFNFELLKSALRKHDEDKKLEAIHVGLFEKIMDVKD